MSKEEVYKCDMCGRITEDIYSNKGWIDFTDCRSITIYNGRSKDGLGKTFYKNVLPEHLTFCSIGCLIDYLDKMMKRGDKNE